jgi:hypothetical protein
MSSYLALLIENLLEEMGDVPCILKIQVKFWQNSARPVPVGEGTKTGRLYLLNGRLLGQTMPKLFDH